MMYFLLILGITLLLVGGDALVRGASGIAKSLGVSPLIVGLTVVAFGTSAPELVVNVLAALEGNSSIGFGNVVGSNLANIGLILGIAAIIMPLTLQGQIIRREIPLLLLVTCILLVMSSDFLFTGNQQILDRGDGAILLLLFSLFLFVTAGDVLRKPSNEDLAVDPFIVNAQQVGPQTPTFAGVAPMWQYVGMVVAGCLLLVLGGKLAIDNGIKIATALNWSEAVVGMVLLAVGTSLPELTTTIMAALRKEPDLAVGNAIGSNMFNVLFVLPISALVRPMAVPVGGAGDLLAGLFLVALLIPFTTLKVFGKARLGKAEGVFLLMIYAGYMYWRVSG